MCETWSQHTWCLCLRPGFGPLKPGCYKDKERNEKKVLDCAAPYGPESLTGQSGARSANSSLSSFSLATSAMNHRTVRARRRTVWCSSRAMAICHVDKRQRSHGAPDGPVLHTGRSGAPQKMKTANQGILCHVLFTIRCTTRQSGAPTNRRQELPTKWSSNGS
jgi:hypothetical protein